MWMISRLALRVLILLGLLYLPLSLHAQKRINLRVDSLSKRLPELSDDTSKVSLLDELSDLCRILDPDKGLEYAEQELELAQKLKWEKGVALAYNSIADNYLTKSNFPLALDYYFKAVKINQAIDNDIDLARNYNHISVVYKHQKDYQKSLDYYSKALKINRARNNYDIWGNAVHAAEQLQQQCEPGKVNISQATYELLEDKFDCQYQGQLRTKGDWRSICTLRDRIAMRKSS